MIEVSYISALIGGLLTFLAPCTLPLIPAYIAFISSNSHNKGDGSFSRSRLFENALIFVMGFSTVFIFFGVISGVIGKFLFEFRSILSQVGGGVIIILGLAMLGAFSFPKFRVFINYFIPKLPSSIIPGTRKDDSTASELLGIAPRNLARRRGTRALHQQA